MGEELGYKLYWKVGDGELVPFSGIEPVEMADCYAELPAPKYEVIQGFGDDLELSVRMTPKSEKLFRKSMRKIMNKIMRTKRTWARKREKARRMALKVGAKV